MNTLTALAVLSLTAGFLSSCSSTAPVEDSFAGADVNGDGLLSRKEISDAVVLSVHYSYDLDKDGHLTLQEWQQCDPEATAALFKRRDTDGSGGITLKEAEASADRQKAFSQVFKKADTNRDGNLSRVEAAAMSAKTGS